MSFFNWNTAGQPGLKIFTDVINSFEDPEEIYFWLEGIETKAF